MLMKNKKGQIMDQLGQLGIGVVGLAIVLVVAFLIMSQGQDQAETLIDSVSVVNESVVWANATVVAFANEGAFELSCTELRTNTSLVISIGNYRVSVIITKSKDRGGL